MTEDRVPHPRTYSLVGGGLDMFLVTDDESGINIGYARKIGGPLTAPIRTAQPAPPREGDDGLLGPTVYYKQPAPPLDAERLAATEWAYDTMPESFDMIRDPVEVWNDRLYPASDDDKDRYRVRAVRILARLGSAPSRSEPE